jgi:hypothetical protein
VNRPGSVASGSNSSPKYHTVSRTSQVDESLFGSAKPGTKAMSRAQNIANFNDMSGAASKAPEVVAVSKSHLKRMMGASPVMTVAQMQELKHASQAAKDKDRAISKARKARMLAMEEDRKKQVVTKCHSVPTQFASLHRAMLIAEQHRLSRQGAGSVTGILRRCDLKGQQIAGAADRNRAPEAASRSFNAHAC